MRSHTSVSVRLSLFDNLKAKIAAEVLKYCYAFTIWRTCIHERLVGGAGVIGTGTLKTNLL